MDELELLQTIYSASENLKQPFTIGPGDDMGEVIIGNQKVLAAVDQLIVGRHVALDTSPALIGRKAVARCFSDIAAMAGTPVGCLMTACLPSGTEQSWANEVFEGARETAAGWGGPIFGGDIASTQDENASFTVHALATPPATGAIKRYGAKCGDAVCITGELGNANESHHLSFTPRIDIAKELAMTLKDGLHSMIDISDGLGQDASHLASRELQIVIQTNLLPLRRGATIQNALCDGEDYELLFTCTVEPTLQDVTVIGYVQTREPDSPLVIDEDANDLSQLGWTHT